MTVTHPVLARGPAMLAASAVDRLDFDDMPPSFAAEGAGVHYERSAKRPRNAREELRRTKAPPDALPGDARAGDTGLAVHHVGSGTLQPIEGAVHADNDARDASVAHQQIAAEADPAHRHIGRQALQERRQVRTIGRREIDLRRATHVPGGMAAHRLVAPDARQEFLRHGQHHGLLPGGRSAGNRSLSLCATELMLPAPMAMITSPSRITSFNDSARSSTRSTKSGSTCPRLRTARQIARPSAPAIGASPAA